MSSPNWIEKANNLGVRVVAEALDVEMVSRTVLALCPACGDGGRGSPKVYLGDNGDERWKCFRCNEGGDAADFVALLWGEARVPDLELDKLEEVRRWVLDELPDAGPSAPPAARHGGPAPATDVTDLWHGCTPAMADDEVRRWLRKARGLDVEAIGKYALARALPIKAKVPKWASCRRVAWSAPNGWRCIVPTFGADGRMGGVRARSVVAGADPKSAAPTGATVKGLVMANPVAVAMLKGGTLPEGAAVVVTEGEPDFLTWATTAPAHAVVGIVQGSWNDDVAARVPDGARVVIRTHHDASGDGYARTVAASLAGRCRVLRSNPNAKDENDAHKAGALDPNPLAEATPMTPTARAAGEEWEPPLELADLPDGPVFPVHVLPDWMRVFVVAVAEDTETPVDLAGMVTLATLAACASKKVIVRIKDTWKEPLNLYVAVALPPGSGKTPVFNAATTVLREYEAELNAAWKAKHGRAAARRDELARDLARLDKRLGSTKDPTEAANLKTSIAGLKDELAGLAVVPAPRLLATDVTPEKLASLLAENHGRLAILSDEGGVFNMMAGTYTREPPLEVYLNGWDGGTLTVDRMGRPSEHIHAPALTIGVTVQPHVLRAVGSKATLTGRGLTDRFLYAVPPDTVGIRSGWGEPVPEGIRAEYGRLIGAVARWPLAIVPDRGVVPKVITLDDDATAALRAFKKELEPSLRPTGPLGEVRGWGSKLTGQVARLAGLLHVGDRANDGEPWKLAVTRATMERAITLGRYLIAHARLAFGIINMDERLVGARKLLRWIGSRATFTRSEAHDGNKWARPVDKLDAALKLLETHGYVRPVNVDRKGDTGRNPKPEYIVNPLWKR